MANRGFGGAWFEILRGLVGRSRVVARFWTLEVPPPRPLMTGLRSGGSPTVQSLVDMLSELGYEVAAYRIDEDGDVRGDIDMGARLSGLDFLLRARRIGRHNHVVVRLGRSPTRVKNAIGFVETGRRADQRGIEFARYTIARLARLFPGLRYKDMSSRTTSDTTELLEASLPERPAGLR